MVIVLFFVFSSLIAFASSHASVPDFCVADFSLPYGPAGYSCKSPSNVTVGDFIYSGLNVPGNTSNIFRAVTTPVSDTQLPGLNGQGISLARVDIATGGVVPLHIHRGATEAIIVVQGTVRAGFIASDDRVYLETLKRGDSMVFPQGLLHFQINSGIGLASLFTAYSSQNPGLQIVDFSLFRNNFPTELITRTTFIEAAEVRRLKRLFGGTN